MHLLPTALHTSQVREMRLRLSIVLTRTFGGPPDAGTRAAARRLVFEAHAMALLEDLRAKTDRAESSEARTLPLAEKVERVRQIKNRLVYDSHSRLQLSHLTHSSTKPVSS